MSKMVCGQDSAERRQRLHDRRCGCHCTRHRIGMVAGMSERSTPGCTSRSYGKVRSLLSWRYSPD